MGSQGAAPVAAAELTPVPSGPWGLGGRVAGQPSTERSRPACDPSSISSTTWSPDAKTRRLPQPITNTFMRAHKRDICDPDLVWLMQIELSLQGAVPPLKERGCAETSLTIPGMRTEASGARASVNVIDAMLPTHVRQVVI